MGSIEGSILAKRGQRMNATIPLAVITGGGRGIGKGISLRLASEGYRVLLTYNSDSFSAEETVDEAEEDDEDGIYDIYVKYRSLYNYGVNIAGGDSRTSGWGANHFNVYGPRYGQHDRSKCG